jgi:hypothetical protein
MGDHKFVFALTALMLKVSWELLEDTRIDIHAANHSGGKTSWGHVCVSYGV